MKIAIHLESASESQPVRWAIGELSAQLGARGFELSDSGDLRIVATTSDSQTLPPGLELPFAPESFVILRSGDHILVWGHDARGLVYGITEIADRVRYKNDDPFDFPVPIVETPLTRVRSISRVFSSEAADKRWFHDRSGWIEYLSMLVYNRFNRFSLTLGMAYNYPYHNNMLRDVYLHFPYPFLVKLDGYDIRVLELPDAEREANLDMLRFIAREAARRGLDFQLGLWTQRYDFDTAVQANYTIAGVTPENFPAYCRDAAVRLLTECPEIGGLTLRIHVESGIEEQDYGFWQNFFAGVASVGRPIELDLHPKGLDQAMLGMARDSGMPIAVSPKYIAEHMALPYHPASIREHEYPPAATGNVREQLSRGTRKFLRYSYGDLLGSDRQWKVIFRIWPGTQRVLLWGDAALAAGYARSSAFCGADGIELCEPQTFRGRQGTGTPGARHNYRSDRLASRYDWQKYSYQYRVWGRSLFSGTANPDGWQRFLHSECGDAAPFCELGLSSASRILPLITQTHGPSASNNLYWPEIYTNLAVLGDGLKRPYGGDMDQPTRFGNVSTLDPQLFANPREYAEDLPFGRLRKYSPLDTADWLETLAQQTDEQALALKGTERFHTAPVQRIHVDLQILAGLGRFFAEKYRAACWAEIFILTAITEARHRATDHVRRAHLAWKALSLVAADVYQDDLAFGIQSYMRGSWASRLGDIELELQELESWRDGDQPAPLHPGEAGLPYLKAIKARVKTVSRQLAPRFKPRFQAGEAIEIMLDSFNAETDILLHYRHVNQAERWQSAALVATPEGLVGTIPKDYSNSPYHLQFYLTARDAGVVMSPGLAADFSNEPYHIILQR